MKVERLLGIGIYLMNHHRVTAQTLATRFGISTVEVKREIHTLILAGIPIITTYGIDGGYEILEFFKKKSHLQNQYDYSNIKEALISLGVAINHKTREDTLEQMELLVIGGKEYKLLGPFEKKEEEIVFEKVFSLQQSMIQRKRVHIIYQNNEKIDMNGDIEVVIMIYKGGGWQVLCYFVEEDKYQGIPAIWIHQIQIKEQGYSKVHSLLEVKNVWAELEVSLELTNIKIFCSKDLKESVDEYFHGRIIEEYESGDFIYEFQGSQTELAWYGTLFLLWKDIKIMEPIRLIEKTRVDCNLIIDKYKDV